MIFEWDENKNRMNKAKHDIDFETAATVFNDPLSGSKIDDDGRWQTIGRSDGCHLLLFVAHTYQEFGEIVIRIISAREVTQSERKLYEKGIF